MIARKPTGEVARDVQPFEASSTPVLNLADPVIRPALSDLLTAVTGFPHYGAAQTAILDAIRWLRVHPEACAALGLKEATPDAR